MCYETFQIKRNKSDDVYHDNSEENASMATVLCIFLPHHFSQALSPGNNQDVEMGISSFSGVCYMRFIHIDKHFVTLSASTAVRCMKVHTSLMYLSSY